MKCSKCESAVVTTTPDRYPSVLGPHGYEKGPLAVIEVCSAGHVVKRPYGLAVA